MVSRTLKELTDAFHLWRSYAETELGEEPEGFESARAWLASFLEALDEDLAEERAAVAAALASVKAELKAAAERGARESDGSTLARQE